MKYFLIYFYLIALAFCIINSRYNKVKIINDESVVAPVINCSKSQTNVTESGKCYVFEYVYASSTEGIEIKNNINNNGFNASGEFYEGKTTVEFTAINKTTSMISTCYSTINVIDSEKPRIKCPQDINVTADTEYGKCGKDIQIDISKSVKDNCGISSITNSMNNDESPSGFYPVGETKVIITATDFSGNTASCTFIVQVIDKTAPVIVCSTDTTVSTELNTCSVPAVSSELSAVANDNCNKNLKVISNSPSVFPLGTSSVTWNATDESGNSAQCVNQINVIDTENPTIKCSPNVVIPTNPGSCSGSYNLQPPECTDNCGVKDITDPGWTGFNIGSNDILYYCHDTSGNYNQCTTRVSVEDREPPSIQCPSSKTYNADPGTCTKSINLPEPNYSDNCGIKSVTNDFNGDINSSGIYPVGTTKVKYTADDWSYNSSSCTFSVTVKNNDPSIQC
eukprot:TRINITY_DN9685_c0_g1_i1.p1 TRINITY_DN9685_c0_g1~~TRINITY_DN9685_c0_g1_i1.p1  ORF type:complete len:452 (+),score=95.95 TRINITY_DN9685_c0_g1_i1:85-1440(+)